MTSASTPRDIRDVLGMHTGWAKLIVAVYLAAIVVVTVQTREGASAFWPMLLGTALLAMGTIALITLPGDPLPWRGTVALTLVGPVACVLSLWVLPAPFLSPLQAWTHGAGTTILCFLGVRGRWPAAWAGLAAMIAIYGVWGAATGQGAMTGAVYVFGDAGPLAMATLLSFTLRPNSAALLALRDRATQVAAVAAAEQAAQQERDAELQYLTQRATPLLEEIVATDHLANQTRVSCELLEAHLRDRLRAPALAGAAISDAARAARERGVEVLLIDDHGMDESPPSVRQAIEQAVVEALLQASEGTVRVRILPQGRDVLASILTGDDAGTRRVDFGVDGVSSMETRLPSEA